MAITFKALIVLVLLSDVLIGTHGLGVGVNYGQIADNLPPPSSVSTLLTNINITRVKLYDADPKVLNAFANTDVEFIIALGNGDLQTMSDPNKAQSWIQENIQPYLSKTKITGIFVGNELLTQKDSPMKPYLASAMQSVYHALGNLGLNKQIYVTTAHSFDVMATSYPPSSGVFREDLAQYMQQILTFHAQTNSPFLINAYPFFAYKDSSDDIGLDYVLFQPNDGKTDPVTNLKYDNMLYAQIDAVYAAMKAMGHTDIPVQISETGWPSKGDPDEKGATIENAGTYNRNLIKRIQQGQGTPAKPSVPIDVYIFALFNENQKTGPVSERNFGLYYPDGSPVYDIGLHSGNAPPFGLPGTTPFGITYSASQRSLGNTLLYVVLSLLWCLFLSH